MIQVVPITLKTFIHISVKKELSNEFMLSKKFELLKALFAL